MSYPPPSAPCPFCSPRPENIPEHWSHIATLQTSSLYLTRNQAYRGNCLLIYDPAHVIGIEQLASDVFQVFSRDLHRSARAIQQVCDPDLMNYATLGNVIEHLHWHLIPRYRNDPRWGKPIWTTTQSELADVTLRSEESDQLVEAIRSALG